jgi:pyruvate, water dikinase
MMPRLVLSGVAASTGVRRGVVVKLEELSARAPTDDDIVLVGEMIPPDASLVPGVCAIVTEEGGILCHGAVLAREMRIPCVVSVRDATGLLPSGAWVTVDGTKGDVYTD